MHSRSSATPASRWARRLAPVAVATAGLAALVAGPAAPVHAACCHVPGSIDGGPDYRVVEYGPGDYDYIYDNGLHRIYRSFRFIGEYYL